MSVAYVKSVFFFYVSRNTDIGSGADPPCHLVGRGLGIFPGSKAAVA